jgi:hypothetical protein
MISYDELVRMTFRCRNWRQWQEVREQAAKLPPLLFEKLLKETEDFRMALRD